MIYHNCILKFRICAKLTSFLNFLSSDNTSSESCRAHVDNSSDEHFLNTKRSGFPDVWDDPDSDVTSLSCHHDYTSVVNVHHGLSCVVDTHHWCLEIDQKAEDIFRLDDKKK